MLFTFQSLCETIFSADVADKAIGSSFPKQERKEEWKEIKVVDNIYVIDISSFPFFLFSPFRKKK